MESTFHPAFYIASWIFFSNMTIMFNKWLLDTAGFRYPIILTTIHLIISSIIVHLLARFTPLLSSRHDFPITKRLYFRTILPIGLLYTLSLALSNLAYLYLSVPFIQMLKAAAPISTLLLGWASGIGKNSFSVGLLVNVLVIVAGVVLSSVGELHFGWFGFCVQMAALAVESGRLLFIQALLSGDDGVKMDPLVGLYYYAPPCALLNALLAIGTEVPTFDWADLERVGWLLLAGSGLVAFMLNVASVSLIGKSSALAMNLTGIFKSILLVVLSLLIWPTPVTPLQVIGYTVALVGLFMYSVSPTERARLKEYKSSLEESLGSYLGFAAIRNMITDFSPWRSDRYSQLSSWEDEEIVEPEKN